MELRMFAAFYAFTSQGALFERNSQVYKSKCAANAQEEVVNLSFTLLIYFNL